MPVLVFAELRINYGAGGWAEKYFFPSSTVDPALALEKAKQIVWGRSAFFGTDTECVYARCSRVGPPKDKETVFMDFPIGPHPSWAGGGGPGDTLGLINDPDVCVQQVLQAEGGKWANRYYHCVPDSWITGKTLATGIRQYFTPQVANSTPDLSPTGGLSHLQVCQGFWRYLIRETVNATKVSATNYTPTAYKDIGYVQVTSKPIGRPFRVSVGRRPTNIVH